MPALDRYEADTLDDDDYDPMSIEDRLAAEDELQRRDRETLKRGIEDGLIYGDLFRSCLSSFVVSCLTKSVMCCRRKRRR